MRFLITGGAGFIGSKLALHLRQAFDGTEVVRMDSLHRRGSGLNVPRLEKAGVKVHRGDVRDAGSFLPGPFDFLIGCSAKPSMFADRIVRPIICFGPISWVLVINKPSLQVANVRSHCEAHSRGTRRVDWSGYLCGAGDQGWFACGLDGGLGGNGQPATVRHLPGESRGNGQAKGNSSKILKC